MSSLLGRSKHRYVRVPERNLQRHTDVNILRGAANYVAHENRPLIEFNKGHNIGNRPLVWHGTHTERHNRVAVYLSLATHLLPVRVRSAAERAKQPGIVKELTTTAAPGKDKTTRPGRLPERGGGFSLWRSKNVIGHDPQSFARTIVW
jgi:hypothetical protein